MESVTLRRSRSPSVDFPGLQVPASLQLFTVAHPTISTAYTQDVEMSLPPEGEYPTFNALFDACQTWSLPRGYAFTTTRSVKKPGSLRAKVYVSCDRVHKVKNRENIRTRQYGTRGTGCQFGVLAVENITQTGWELKHRPDSKFGRHNHAPSTDPAAHPSHRKMPPKTRDLSQVLYNAGTFYIYRLYIM